ncbi:MAG TPA: alpha-glucan family phosphorylase [Mycobacteriales bacterium]|nr:alpha-glucan family phosphorylase [Mycobacteriales bacterium]
MRALRRFTVRAALPEPLAPLGDLVMNLRWSWHPDSLDLFEAVDPETWDAVGHDPVRLLGEVGADRMAALAKDRRFLRRLSDMYDDLQDYLEKPRWYQTLEDAPRAIAYFSPEFGITEVLPQYSGGLGILAGDHLKAASDLGVPIIGVGLLYRRGYFNQSLSRDGWQQERYPPLDPNGLPLTLLREGDGPDGEGQPVRVAVGLPEGRVLRAQVWRAQVGRVPLLMLDSDVEDNAPAEREVTDRLYGGGTDHRLLQEMLLGIGGVRAVRRFCALTGHAEPEVFHTNEGHAGFLGLERIRELTEDQGLDFDEALAAVRAGTVFTTHTPVPAGIDRFPMELIAHHFGGDNACRGVPLDRILALGAEADPDTFNMAHMGLRLAQRANGVSKLHGQVSREMFGSLWAGFDTSDVPITSITNGVHAPTWVARDVMEIAAREVGPELVEEAQGWEGIAKVSDESIWATRRALRLCLVEEVRRRLRESWLHRGASEAGLGWIDGVFDPDVLTIGFARRVPSYKRLTLMLRDPERLTRILLDPERPVQMVIAGKSHPADDGGKALIQQMVRFTDDPLVRHRIVFLPDYDMGMARYLYHGCDVWLNNPLRPLEACGTSGMKSALNGGLNLSIRDGWWDEMYDGGNGWAIPSAAEGIDPDLRDDQEATALYDLIENQVRARFYDVVPGTHLGVVPGTHSGAVPAGQGGSDHDRLPRRWIEMVRHTLQSLGPQVLASRMVRDYVVELYAPAAASARAMSTDRCAGARELAGWVSQVRSAWPEVRVAHVESSGVGDAPQRGQQLEVHAVIELGRLSPNDVRVQVAFGAVDENDELRNPDYVELGRPAGEPLPDGAWRYEGAVPLERRGSFGYTVRVLPDHPALASPADLGLVALPVESTAYTAI